MTKSLYEEILENYLPEFKRICKGDVKILMDNNLVHKSMNSLLFYKQHKIKVIDFPPYSPDLNPIENIWKKRDNEERISDIVSYDKRYLKGMGWYHRELVEELFCKYEWQNEELIKVKGFNFKVLKNFYFSFNFT